MPCMNQPAVMAGKRTSGLDGGNLNRSFPGDPDGNVTGKIADYFPGDGADERRGARPASGGRTLDIIPFGASRVGERRAAASRARGAKAFGAPYAMMMFELDAAALFDTAVESQGKIFIGHRAGWRWHLDARASPSPKRGVRNVLIHYGLMEGTVEMPAEPQVYLDMPDASCYVQSEHSGLLEVCFALGERVEKGQDDRPRL
ncbi:hypothetical protein DSL92_01810 [Billgrantia gudaonensis]|uniref:Succinylglutamate desuccinylase/Aspartoacylase catalytic domain-containing protein n=1 Tax=Billgrantia gudaonensis TaxID=376427 RepID=A0A3S0NEG7_9GAMM|nr:hypothetical protein DSL92_01810 [Halomonas gudaonensis]